MGLQWRAESQTTKDHFKHMANVLKEQHLKDNPEYSYQPRKSADKKRRMTRKKAAALANITGPMMFPTSAALTSSTTASDSVSPNSMEHGSFDAPVIRTELDKTPAGNLTFTLGDETWDEQNLRELLSNHNQSISLPHPFATNSPAFIYSERSDEAQDDMNWWANSYNFEEMTAMEERAMQSWQEEFSANVHPLDNATERQRQVLYGRQTAHLMSAELLRTQAMRGNDAAATTETLRLL